MNAKINGSEPFKVISDSCTVAATTCGYTFAVSATKDGVYTGYSQATPANEVLIVNGLTRYSWAKLDGNTDEGVIVVMN